MAKKEKKVLLWFQTDRHDCCGRAYYYDNLTDLMKQIMLGKAWYCIEPEKVRDFIYDLQRGAVKATTVQKNYNSNAEKTKFENVEDGDYIVRNIVNINSTQDDFYKMDSNFRSNTYVWGMYAKFNEPRELTQTEKDEIQEVIQMATGLFDVDDVFNLFGVLCCAKGIWNNYDDSRMLGFLDDGTRGRKITWYDDKRQRSHIGFDTFLQFDPRLVKDQEVACRMVAEYAYKLTVALTGYELFVKDYPDVPFVDCMMASRLVRNDEVDMRKLSEPTMTLKDLLEMAAGEKEVPNWNNTIKVLLGKCILGAKGNRFLDTYLPLGDVKCVEVNTHDLKELNVKIEDFDKVEHCVAWSNNSIHNETFIIYIWDDTAMTYDMMGSTENFVRLIKNQ